MLFMLVVSVSIFVLGMCGYNVCLSFYDCFMFDYVFMFVFCKYCVFCVYIFDVGIICKLLVLFNACAYYFYVLFVFI